jgi:hypothetical protein
MSREGSFGVSVYAPTLALESPHASEGYGSCLL